MPSQYRLLSLVPVAVLVAACAHTPPAKEPAMPAAVDAAAVKEQFIRAGFKPFTYRQKLYYCRAEQVTGTQFKRQVCLTEAQMVAQARDMQQVSRDMTLPRIGPKCDIRGQTAGVSCPN